MKWVFNMKKFNEFTILFPNYVDWMGKVLELNIFDDDTSAEMYFLKYQTNEYDYLSYSIQRIFQKNQFNLKIYYENEFKNEFTILGIKDIINFKNDFFALNKNSLGFLFLNFKHTQPYANTMIDFHIERDKNNKLVFKTVDDIIFRIFKEFINKNPKEKYLLVDRMIEFIIKSQEYHNKKFDLVFISYVFTVFLEKIFASPSTIQKSDYKYNFENLKFYKPNLLEELEAFYSLYTKLNSNNYLILYKLNYLTKDTFEIFLSNLANTQYKWTIPYLTCSYKKN